MPVAIFNSASDLAAFVNGIASRGLIKTPEPFHFQDGAYIDLDDGANPVVRFHFDRSGTYVPGGGYNATNIRVDISAATDANDVATALSTAINSVGAGLAITADAPGAGDNKFNLENDSAGAAGNVDIVKSATSPFNLTVEGMSGGGGPVAHADVFEIKQRDGFWYLFHA